MKKFLTYISTLSVLLIFSGCDFLNQYPDSQANTEIDTLDKVAELLTGAYPQMSYFRFLELRTDNVGDKGDDFDASLLNQAMYYWNNYSEEEVDSPKMYWIECYRGIAQANQALQSLAHYPDKDNPRVQALYAEAFLIRAYLHFMVANIWAQTYQGKEQSQSIDGIFYMELPERNAIVNYKLETLEDTYRKIERDLEYGLALVRDEYYDRKIFHFNKKAAYAFAARFYAYTAQWQKVIDYASFVIGNQPQSTLAPYTLYETMTESQLLDFYSSEQNPGVLLKTTTESLWQQFYKTDRYGLSKSKYDEVLARLNSKTLPQISGYFRPIKSNSYLSRYYPKFVEFISAEGRLNSTRGHYTENVLLSVEETMLYRIEAYAMLEQYDLAMNDLVTFANLKHQDRNSGLDITSLISELQIIDISIRNRILPFYRPLTQQQASIFYVVAELRQMQFIHEGLRWFDICRFNLAVDRNIAGQPRASYNILQPEDPRKVLNFPDEVSLLQENNN